jgi:hypothetical protein
MSHSEGSKKKWKQEGNRSRLKSEWEFNIQILINVIL